MDQTLTEEREMGRYINSLTPGAIGWELPAHGKVQELLKIPGAHVIPRPIRWEPNMVCVIDNDDWEAALWLDTAEEMRRADYRPDDFRWRTWLIVPGADKLARP